MMNKRTWLVAGSVLSGIVLFGGAALASPGHDDQDRGFGHAMMDDGRGMLGGGMMSDDAMMDDGRGMPGGGMLGGGMMSDDAMMDDGRGMPGGGLMMDFIEGWLEAWAADPD